MKNIVVAGMGETLSCPAAASATPLARRIAASIAMAVAFATSGAWADLVAKWDFNSYDSSKPKSANVLQATTGGDAKPRYKNGKGSDPTADGSLGEMYVVSDTEAAGLGAGNYAIAIPAKSHVALPIPDSVKNHAWAIKIRFYLPEGGKYHSFFNRSNSGDGDLFTNNRAANALGFSGTSGYNSSKNNYKTPVTAGAWHTLVISAGDQRYEAVLDGTTLAIYNNSDALKNYFNTTEALTDIDGVGHLLLSADENGEDNLMYIDYVELYDNAIFNPIISLTGEWTFPDGNELKAAVGSDLVKWTRGSDTNFTAAADSGIAGDDGYVCAGRNNYFKCYHSLPADSDYTVVMDVRIPDNDNGRQTWHALFKGNDNNTDADVFIKKENGGLKVRTVGENTIPLGADFGEWVRLAIVYRNGVSKTVYANGVKKCTAVNVPEWMVSTAGGYFLLLGDNDGEDWDVDISYAAIYYGAFADDEIAAFHSTPLGVSSPVLVEAPVIAASDVLKTWPWQQNVYTNRFTIMCEGVKDAENAARWNGLEVQYGANYENRAVMTRVESNGGTWIYKAQIVTNGAEGATIPYRLGYFGLPLAYENAAENTAGEVKLWDEDPEESFSFSLWGDNQQGAKDGDWDSNKFLYLTNMFCHMVAQGVDFGVSSGDMASYANYATQIRPCVLDTTDAIFGRARPYYVSWGNHEYGCPDVKPFMEQGSINEPGYGTSESGNYHLYRNNVLFAFVDYGVMSDNATKTWLANVLGTERARNARFRILVIHCPFWLECWGAHTRQTLLDTAKAGGIDIVFSGHMHGYERIFKDGIMQVTNGGAGHLDHTEKVERNYGDATFVGGHKDMPYLWARQKSAAETGVLGPAEPVRMGCLQCYGVIKVEGNVLAYTAHAFNADGSYIGVCDDFSITSKTCVATASSPSAGATCANPLAYAEFTTKPVSNAAWKDYKGAVGEAFSYAEGEGDKPVVNVSKNDIEKFLAWLNGASGTYRLPTVGELETAFSGDLRRKVAEWTSGVDPMTGWCRILGSPEIAAEWAWSSAADKPCIATAGCHANYLGFRLATGPAPEETVDPASLEAALVALAEVENPAAVYKWENGALVDVSSDWASPSGDLTYSVPVIFTGTGELSYDLGAYNAVIGGGFAAQGSLSLTKGGSGTLTVGGEIRGGGIGWFLASDGALKLDGASCAGPYARFRSGDGTLRLEGASDFKATEVPVMAGDCSNYVAAAVAPATFRAKSIAHNDSAGGVTIGGGVSVSLSRDFQFAGTYDLAVDGVLEAEAVNMLGNDDPWIVGSGTVRTGYFGTYENSWIRLAVSNVVFTTSTPLRSNKAKGYTALFVAGDEVHLSSTCDWTIGETDAFGKNIFVLGDKSLSSRPKLVVEGAYNAVFSPYATSGTANGGPTVWDLEMAGTGTLTIGTRINGDIAVSSGTLAIPATANAAFANALSLADGATLEIDLPTSGIVPLTLPRLMLPETGVATLRIDGKRLRSGGYVLLDSVPANYANLKVDSSSAAIAGRRASVIEKNGRLVLDIEPAGLTVIIR